MSKIIQQIASDTERLLQEAEEILIRVEQQVDRTEPRQLQENKTVTEQNTAKPRNKNREANQAAVELLIAAYPNTFNLEEPKPLKIGIQEDLVADEKVSRGKIKRALATYVRNPRYLQSMVVGAQRVDLTGAEVAEVTSEDEKHAKAKLDEYKQRRKERHQEARKQQRVAQKEERLTSKLEALVKKF